MPSNVATEILRKFYNEWPGGFEEIESAVTKKPPDRIALEAAFRVIVRLLHTHEDRDVEMACTIAKQLIRAEARDASDDELNRILNLER
jgi:hypothetical protein